MSFPNWVVTGILLATGVGLGQDMPAKQRHFVLRYSVKVKDVPAGKELHIWIPLAHSDAFQDVQIVSKQGDLKLHKSAEDAYGNTALYAETETSKLRYYRFAVEYDVIRTERIDLRDGKLAPGAHPERASQAMLTGYLRADRLVPITGPIAQIAAEETKSAGTPVEKARAIYDYILRTIRLDASSSSCCQGDAVRTVESKHGDSTDLAALFIAMARSVQLPARSVFGFQLPADRPSGELPSHSSWAEFYAAPMGWLPADLAAAVGHPDDREYYFGAIDVNRFQFTFGRDLKLNPPQASGPVNFLIDPYVEVGGAPYSKVALDVSFNEPGGSNTVETRH